MAELNFGVGWQGFPLAFLGSSFKGWKRSNSWIIFLLWVFCCRSVVFPVLGGVGQVGGVLSPAGVLFAVFSCGSLV